MKIIYDMDDFDEGDNIDLNLPNEWAEIEMYEYLSESFIEKYSDKVCFITIINNPKPIAIFSTYHEIIDDCPF